MQEIDLPLARKERWSGVPKKADGWTKGPCSLFFEVVESESSPVGAGWGGQTEALGEH